MRNLFVAYALLLYSAVCAAQGALVFDQINITPIVCDPPESVATVTLSAIGGTAPYSYTFNNTTNTTGTFDNISIGPNNGVYLATITDAVGRIVSATVKVGPTQITNTLQFIFGYPCEGGTNGFLIAAITNVDTEPLIFTLTTPTEVRTQTILPGAIDTELCPLASGTITISARTANNLPNCEVASVSLDYVTGGEVTITELRTTVESSVAQGTITVVAQGGTGMYKYQLNALPPQTSNVFTNLDAGTYTIRVFSGTTEAFNQGTTCTTMGQATVLPATPLYEYLVSQVCPAQEE